jgi:arabinofuranosyltransferase
VGTIRSLAADNEVLPGSTRLGRIGQWAMLATPLVLIAATGWAHRWTTDDGFIYYRVVQQVRAGNGPVFNAGERVEAFTGPLWLAILSIADLATPVRLEWIGVFLGLGFTVAGVGFAMAGAARLVRVVAPDAFLVPFGVLAFAVLRPSWVFATSGLETGLTFMWLGASMWLLGGWARAGTSRLPLWQATVLGLGWLVRPDLALFSVAFLLVVLALQWRADRWADRVKLVVAVTALPVAYQIFRMGYYGSLVANTAIAKEATRLRPGLGWDYLTDFGRPYWLPFAVVVLVAGGYAPLLLGLRQVADRRGFAVVVAFLTAALLHGAYIVLVGGDYLHARLLVPSWFALGVPVAVIPATRRFVASVALLPWLFVCALWLAPTQRTLALTGFTLPDTPGVVTTDDVGFGEGGRFRAWYDGPGYYFERGFFQIEKRDIPLRRTVPVPIGAFAGIGAVSYAMGPDFAVLDTLGLADAFTAHLHTMPDTYFLPRKTGHEKPLPAQWTAARLTRPGAPTAPDDYPDSNFRLIPLTQGAAFEAQVGLAQDTLRCGPLRRLDLAVRAPMTPGRFLRNLVQAPGNTRLRIPPDPEAAHADLCGDDDR